MRYLQERLGDYIDVIPGYAFKSGDFIESGIPIIKIKNVTPPTVSLDDLSYVSKEIANDLQKYELTYDDVLIALTGSHINQMASVVGRVARVEYNMRSLMNQRVGKIITKDTEKMDLDFCYYFLSQDKIKILLAKKAGGAANQANISASDIKELFIPLPSIDYQRIIAKILRAYDNLIENNQRQIKLLEESAMRLYKEWFVNLRFPGYLDKSFVEKAPEGWKLGTLCDLVNFRRGQTITRDSTNSGTIPVVAGGISPAYYHDTANTQAPVITISASGANAGFVKMYHQNVWASDCSYIDKKSCDCLYFVYCYLANSKDAIKNLQKGAAQPHVYPKDLNRLTILLPTEDVIKQYNDAVEPIFSAIGILNKVIECATHARDRLLPKLMSGEIEV